MHPIINLLPGSIFKCEDSVFIKLTNPEIPRLAKISNYPVWAADTGNGHIKKFDPRENVNLIGNCFELLRL